MFDARPNPECVSTGSTWSVNTNRQYGRRRGSEIAGTNNVSAGKARSTSRDPELVAPPSAGVMDEPLLHFPGCPLLARVGD